MQTTALRATGLVKQYRRGRVGPNGAGKTTTLLMSLGVVKPDAGTVQIFGHRLPQARHAAMAAGPHELSKIFAITEVVR
jgi:ABC-2 type transport system ATP-binding protein